MIQRWQPFTAQKETELIGRGKMENKETGKQLQRDTGHEQN